MATNATPPTAPTPPAEKAGAALKAGTYSVRNKVKADDGGGPRGFQTAEDGEVFLNPGQSAKVTLTEDEAKRLSKFPDVWAISASKAD